MDQAMSFVGLEHFPRSLRKVLMLQVWFPFQGLILALALVVAKVPSSEGRLG